VLAHRLGAAPPNAHLGLFSLHDDPLLVADHSFARGAAIALFIDSLKQLYRVK